MFLISSVGLQPGNNVEAVSRIINCLRAVSPDQKSVVSKSADVLLSRIRNKRWLVSVNA